MTHIEEIEAALVTVATGLSQLATENKRMREALNRIDAIVPPIPHLPACSAPALRGILERIGGLITAALKGTQS